MNTKRTVYGWTRNIGKLHIMSVCLPICGTDAKIRSSGTNPPPRPICHECEKAAGLLDEPALRVLMGEEMA